MTKPRPKPAAPVKPLGDLDRDMIAMKTVCEALIPLSTPRRLTVLKSVGILLQIPPFNQ